MTIASAPPVQPLVEDAGFKLVEEDDVAFALSLCREIHRIYGSYHEGTLASNAEMRSGLLMTWDVLATLRETVVDGMPALRIQVAAAQTREMASVLFGQALSRLGDRPVLDGQAARPGLQVADTGPALTAPPRQLPGVASTGVSGRSWPAPESQDRVDVDGLAPGGPDRTGPNGPSGDPVPAAAAAFSAGRSGEGRVGRWADLPAAARLVGGFLLCCLIGALVDVPLAVLAVFPNLVLQLAVAFLVVPTVIVAGLRAVRRRRPGGSAMVPLGGGHA